jgi:transcription elongation GreA/GreB family factor
MSAFKVTAVRGGGTTIMMTVVNPQCKATLTTDIRSPNGRAMLEKKVGDGYAASMFAATTLSDG